MIAFEYIPAIFSYYCSILLAVAVNHQALVLTTIIHDQQSIIDKTSAVGSELTTFVGHRPSGFVLW